MISQAFLDKANLMGGWYVSPELCRSLVEDFKNKKNKWNQAHSARGYHFLSNFELNPSLIQEYDDAINTIVKQYTECFPHAVEGMASMEKETPYNFQLYPPGNHYSVWHCENNGQPQYNRRHLAYMTYLNTVSTGGETHFLYQNLKFTPQIGLTLIWPAYFTHTHKGIPAEFEEKYIATGWYKFFDSEKFMDDVSGADDATFYDLLDKMSGKVT